MQTILYFASMKKSLLGSGHTKKKDKKNPDPWGSGWW